jgi:hypothetical protein
MNDKTVYCCPECGSSNVQSPEWCRWDITTKKWVSAGDNPAGSEFWCGACEVHHKSLDERDATPAEIAAAGDSVRDDLVAALKTILLNVSDTGITIQTARAALAKAGAA